MWFNVFILFCVLVYAGALYEGDFCVKDGLAGICKGIEQCPPAIEDLKNRKIPQICGFVGTDSIVCCVDNSVTHLNPVATTTEKSYTPDYSGYSPDVPDYKDTNTQREDCEPVPPTYTIPKTGKRALDKCIEYQEKFVYPCEKGIALMPGSKSRGTHCHHSTTELIIGGEKAKEHEFPHMVMVGYGNSRGPLILQCGGAIISNTFVLTAGHCIASREQLNATYVVVGALNRTEARDPSKVYNIKNVIKHPLYFPPDKYNDIALFELERPIKLDQFTVPACLHVGDEVNDTRVLATGWGLTKDKDKTSESEVLQKVILEKFHDLECAGNFIPNRNLEQGFNSYTQTCYGHKTKARDTCNGDSGGPLQIKNQKIHCMYTVVGVTSFGRKCGEIDRPGMYTKVAPYVSWIEDIVWPEG